LSVEAPELTAASVVIGLMDCARANGA